MINIFCDGGARGNPGPAAYGFVVKNGPHIIAKVGGYLGIATNNVAEYTAIIKALGHLARDFKGQDLEIFLDSQLAASQLAGIFKVKNATIRQLVMQIRQLEPNFGQIRYIHIPRSQNQEADKLVNQALDDRLFKN